MKFKVFRVVVLFYVTCMLTAGCAHHELTAYDNNLENLKQQALRAPDGKVCVRQGFRFNSDIGGKHIGVIDAPADICWQEVLNLMQDENRLMRIYVHIPFFEKVKVNENTGGNGISMTYKARAIIVPTSVNMGFYVDEENRTITGNKTGGSFGSFVVKDAEHDIGVIPIDKNRSLLIVRFLGKVVFPGSVGANMGTTVLGMSKKISPEMTSAFIDEVRRSVSNYQNDQ